MDGVNDGKANTHYGQEKIWDYILIIYFCIVVLHKLIINSVVILKWFDKFNLCHLYF